MLGNRRGLRTWLLVFVTGLLVPFAAMLTGATSQASASLFCSAGTYSNGSVCTPASPGYYVALSGQTSQTACPAGFYQPASGSTSCITTNPGYYDPPASAANTHAPRGPTSPPRDPPLAPTRNR